MARAALVQMVSSANTAENLQQAEQLLKQARDNEADLVLLPENFAFMGLHEQDKLAISEVYGVGPIQERLSRLAKELRLWVIAGTIPLKSNGSKVRASCLVYDDQGKCAARYDKIHLFDVKVSSGEAYQESMSIERGHDLALVETPIGKIGLTVCYDLRFPELYQLLMLEGAQLFTVPSAFTAVTGLAHWEILLRARAIENLCYVLAANQGGQHENGRSTFGHSMIIDPWGRILTQKEKGPGIVVADIDLHNQKELRQNFPCLDHHVLNL
ncbi:carbon-nitrogen hydrolase family protein [Fluoribacter dumoffii]|uniref:N-carbamoyl-D-amino acid hydrolase n=1 Tax=Fluoribacter dumoffii TaxID=463 RepID=A0A377GAR9_9GAMM|nr:carbon-nitrogen hydrolase family protein [Fluoribacter dumoffii]KTC88698.1 hydrolase [Fluoribacter dumoffii NY 23]MCW8386009.1 carbon-nitrogen hydrolase family protein [Fluoribacter dumoffii]MCW8495696.1 carbon-nitrogen hydrolase family protein [Fluoribacter dumoffii]STO21814.1 N-carbamoyl-D-amino acid hydrolase [Fluoribacter dumoffii]